MYVPCVDLAGETHLVKPEDLVDRSSAYGVYIEDESVLLVQDFRSLRWELPGGGLEDDETPIEALKREFTEETGLTISNSVAFITKWTEHFYETDLRQGWLSHRSFFRVPEAEGALRHKGNGDDALQAKLIPFTELENYTIKRNIMSVILGVLAVEKNS